MNCQVISAEQLAKRLQESFRFKRHESFRGEVSLWLTDPFEIRDICHFAKKDLTFDYLIDISSVDHYGEDPRFEIIYELYGYSHHRHLRLIASVSESSSILPSVVSVWKTANWHEREIYDMMGIRFEGHPDLRRILMWEGYQYHPLRKDFPLVGKSTNLPDVAFSKPASLEGGPFISPSGKACEDREPRAHPSN